MRARNFAVSALAAASCFFSAQAPAQGYLGASLGQSDADEDVAAGLIDDGNVDTKDTAFKIFGGYRFHPNFAAELEYVDLGEASYSGTFGGAPVTGGKVGADGFNVSAVAIVPVNERFSVFGKLGMFIWDAKFSDTTGGVPFSGSTDGSDISFGLGAGFDFTQRLSARVEWQRFELDGSDVDLLSAGVAFRF